MRKQRTPRDWKASDCGKTVDAKLRPRVREERTGRYFRMFRYVDGVADKYVSRRELVDEANEILGRYGMKKLTRLI